MRCHRRKGIRGEWACKYMKAGGWYLWLAIACWPLQAREDKREKGTERGRIVFAFCVGEGIVLGIFGALVLGCFKFLFPSSVRNAMHLGGLGNLFWYGLFADWLCWGGSMWEIVLSWGGWRIVPDWYGIGGGGGGGAAHGRFWTCWRKWSGGEGRKEEGGKRKEERGKVVVVNYIYIYIRNRFIPFELSVFWCSGCAWGDVK